MLLLLLVSTQVKKITMEMYKLKRSLISDKAKIISSQVSLDKDKILCSHCKRTASNGVRCMGICVSDNDY